MNRTYHPLIHRVHRLLRRQVGAVALGAVFVAFASITVLTATSVVAQTVVASTRATQAADVDSSMEARGADVRAKLIAQEDELDEDGAECDGSELACASLESRQQDGHLITARLRGEHAVLRNDISQDVTLREFKANYIAGFDENGDPVWVDETGTRPHRFVQVVASGDRVTALDQDGRAWSWGANHAGQAGTGDFIEAREPTPVAPPAGRDEPILFEKLARGVDSSVCGIESDANPASAGTLWCWGYNSDGQFGLGDAAVGKYYPAPVKPATTLRFRDVAMSANTVCAITRTDDLYCWGGLPGTGPAITKPAASPVLTGVRQVAMDANTVVTVSIDGKLRNWARAPLGQDGSGNTGNGQVAPAALIGGGAGSTAVIVPAGQPPGENDNPDEPVTVDVPGKVFEKVYVAPEETGLVKTLACALTADGEAWCWGEGSKGQLGNSANADSPTPVKVNTSGLRLTDLALSSSAVAAVTSQGWLMAWGDGSKGQVGNLNAGDSPAPGLNRGRFVDQRNSRASDYVSVEAATGDKGSFCAMSDTGRVDCWGNNDNLQVGVTGSKVVATPTPVDTGTRSGDFAVGDQFAVAAGHADTWAWGRNSHGQLGRGTVSEPQTPAPVARAAHRYERFTGYVPGGAG